MAQVVLRAQRVRNACGSVRVVAGAVRRLLLIVVVALASACSQSTPATDPLPSWNDGDARRAILDFVARVTREGAPDFVPVAERIATFDNDGTLWGEQPVYAQVAFALDRVKAMAPQHPEWQQSQPFKGVLEGDMHAVTATGERGLLEIMAATHVGTTTEAFDALVREWIGTARHPRTRRLYTEMVYQPMLEVLAYLRSNGFKTFIVSGGGVEFMRPWVERVYGIPPEQVVGSRVKVKYEVRDNRPVLLRLPEVDLLDDRAGKPVGIHQMIGRRPILSFGNSDGDFEMLEWTTAGPGARLALIVHHTDAQREWAYDRTSHIGQLARALDEAPKRGWMLVDMQRDWKTIYPPSAAAGAPQKAGAFLVGSYAGVLPCADCRGIYTSLTLHVNGRLQTGAGTFSLSEEYLDTPDGNRRFDTSGRWNILRGTPTDLDATVYQLDFDGVARTIYVRRVGDQVLQLLDREQRMIQSAANYTLTRTTAPPPAAH